MHIVVLLHLMDFPGQQQGNSNLYIERHSAKHTLYEAFQEGKKKKNLMASKIKTNNKDNTMVRCMSVI